MMVDAGELDKSRILRYEDFESRNIPVESGIEEATAALDYMPGESPLTFRADLNGDGFEELFVAPLNYRLCGTAGCPYMLVEGASKTLIGEFFGTVAITSTKINGFPVIQAISKRDLESTNLQIYVYDGARYTIVGHALLESKGMDAWRDTLEDSQKLKQ